MTGAVQPACDMYAVPKAIREHIDFITPGIKLLSPAVGAGNAPRQPSDRSSSGSSGSSQAETKRRAQPASPLGGKRFTRNADIHPARTTSQETQRRSSGAAAHRKHGLGAPGRPEDGLGAMASSDPAAELRKCDKVMTPACIATLYQIPPADPAKVHPNNSLGVYESYQQYWNQDDLDSFFYRFTNITNGTHPIDKAIDGGVASTTDPSQDGFEAMLDLLMAYPIVYPQTITIFNEDDTWYQNGGSYFLGAYYLFNDFLDAIDGSYCTYSAYGETGNAWFDPVYPDPHPGGYKGPLQCGVYQPTNVISISYGERESQMAIAWQKRQCNEFLKLGLQGVSILVSSGDTGVGGLVFDGVSACLGPNNNIFSPGFPMNCPYVTSVSPPAIGRALWRVPCVVGVATTLTQSSPDTPGRYDPDLPRTNRPRP